MVIQIPFANRRARSGGARRFLATAEPRAGQEIQNEMSFGSRSVPECPRANSRRARECGALLAELLVAMAIMAGVLVPLAFSVAAEKRLARATYQRAVAMELVDGEMEILAAGEWRVFPPGTHAYQVRSHSVTNLPPGNFTLTVRSNQVRLEWLPVVKDHGGRVMREAVFK